MKGIKLLITGVVCLMATALFWLVLPTFRAEMIVVVGIIATNIIRLALIGTLALVGLTAMGLGLYQLIPELIRNSASERLQKSSSSFRAKISGPKEVREQLVILKEIRPRLSPELNQCLEQLEDISKLFSRFDQIIETNDAEAVSNGRIGLEEIEKTVCDNFKWAINSIIAADADDTETSVFYKQCIERINRVVTANSRAIDKGNQFLIEIADNVSQLAIDTTMLDAWLETIQEQNARSLIGTRELK